MKPPSSGERHVTRFGYVRRALDELNALWLSGDIGLMSPEDIAALLKARRWLMSVRYVNARNGKNPNRMHGHSR